MNDWQKHLTVAIITIFLMVLFYKAYNYFKYPKKAKALEDFEVSDGVDNFKILKNSLMWIKERKGMNYIAEQDNQEFEVERDLIKLV